MDPHHAPAPDDRHPLYETLHGPLRASMQHARQAIDAADPQDEAALGAALAAIEALLAALDEHMRRERDVLHTALEAIRPGAAARATAEHATLTDSIETLRDETAALRNAPPGARGEAVRRLCRHVDAFVEAKLRHMAHEESALGPALLALYGERAVGELELQMK